MKIIQFSTLVGLMFLMASNSFAQQSFREHLIEEKFNAADKNHDGKLTLEEAKEGMPKVASNFNKIDVNNRGYVTLDQVIKAANSQ